MHWLSGFFENSGCCYRNWISRSSLHFSLLFCVFSWGKKGIFFVLKDSLHLRRMFVWCLLSFSIVVEKRKLNKNWCARFCKFTNFKNKSCLMHVCSSFVVTKQKKRTREKKSNVILSPKRFHLQIEFPLLVCRASIHSITQ